PASGLVRNLDAAKKGGFMSRPPRSNRIEEDARDQRPDKEQFAEQSGSRDDGGPPPYDEWTDKQLMGEAARHSIDGFERMSRDELLTALASRDTQRTVRDSTSAGDAAA